MSVESSPLRRATFAASTAESGHVGRVRAQTAMFAQPSQSNAAPAAAAALHRRATVVHSATAEAARAVTSSLSADRRPPDRGVDSAAASGVAKASIPAAAAPSATGHHGMEPMPSSPQPPLAAASTNGVAAVLWRGLEVAELSADDVTRIDEWLDATLSANAVGDDATKKEPPPPWTDGPWVATFSRQGIDEQLHSSVRGKGGRPQHVLARITDHGIGAGVTLLWQAAATGNSAVVSKLIELGADVEQERADGRVAPLYIACQNEHFGAASVLLSEGGCDVDHARDTGATPLFIATQKGNLACVRLLLHRGADTERKNNQRSTPFVLACSMGHTDIALELLSCGALHDNIATGRSGRQWGKANGHSETCRAVAMHLSRRLQTKQAFQTWRRFALVVAPEERRWMTNRGANVERAPSPPVELSSPSVPADPTPPPAPSADADDASRGSHPYGRGARPAAADDDAIGDHHVPTSPVAQRRAGDGDGEDNDDQFSFYLPPLHVPAVYPVAAASPVEGAAAGPTTPPGGGKGAPATVLKDRQATSRRVVADATPQSPVRVPAHIDVVPQQRVQKPTRKPSEPVTTDRQARLEALFRRVEKKVLTGRFGPPQRAADPMSPTVSGITPLVGSNRSAHQQRGGSPPTGERASSWLGEAGSATPLRRGGGDRGPWRDEARDHWATEHRALESWQCHREHDVLRRVVTSSPRRQPTVAERPMPHDGPRAQPALVAWHPRPAPFAKEWH